MSLDEQIGSFEKYARDFVLYIVEFFNRDAPRTPVDRTRLFNRVTVFSFISAVIGCYVTRTYGQDLESSIVALTNAVIAEFLWWVGCGVVLYGLLRLLKSKISMADAVLMVLRVYSVAWVAGALANYIVYSVFNAIPPLAVFREVAANWSSNAVILAFLVLYLPRTQIGDPSARSASEAGVRKEQRRRAVGSYALIAFVLVRIVWGNGLWVYQYRAPLYQEACWSLQPRAWLPPHPITTGWFCGQH